MITASSALQELKLAQPEWSPWLRVLEEIVREAESPSWDGAVPTRTDPRRDSPLLAGASVSLDAAAVRRLAERLLRLASSAGTDAMRSLARMHLAEPEWLEVFAASLRHDMAAVNGMAAACGADAEALQAVVALLPVPFLQACNRRLADAAPAGWTHGYCAVCGAWPTFAEIRGIERSRHYRCGMCGGEWHARPLVCPFCEMSDHTELAMLVPGGSDTPGVIDACNGCRGYVKAFTRLRGCPPAAVFVEDLASVDLDMAALDHGYTRPVGAGYPVEVTIVAAAPRRGFFTWRS